MNFLARFKSAPELELEAEDLPARRRTITAAKFREEELARAAEARAAAEVEAATSAAAEAARLAQLPDEEDVGESDPESAAEPRQPPMDWEEAVGWLSTRSAEARSLV